jgi:hypothetical protein
VISQQELQLCDKTTSNLPFIVSSQNTCKKKKVLNLIGKQNLSSRLLWWHCAGYQTTRLSIGNVKQSVDQLGCSLREFNAIATPQLYSYT